MSTIFAIIADLLQYLSIILSIYLKTSCLTCLFFPIAIGIYFAMTSERKFFRFLGWALVLIAYIGFSLGIIFSWAPLAEKIQIRIALYILLVILGLWPLMIILLKIKVISPLAGVILLIFNTIPTAGATYLFNLFVFYVPMIFMKKSFHITFDVNILLRHLYVYGIITFFYLLIMTIAWLKDHHNAYEVRELFF